MSLEGFFWILSSLLSFGSNPFLENGFKSNALLVQFATSHEGFLLDFASSESLSDSSDLSGEGLLGRCGIGRGGRFLDFGLLVSLHDVQTEILLEEFKAFPVVLLGISMIPKKLAIHPFGGLVSMFLGFVDTISMILPGLIMCGMILGFGHLRKQKLDFDKEQKREQEAKGSALIGRKRKIILHPRSYQTIWTTRRLVHIILYLLHKKIARSRNHQSILFNAMDRRCCVCSILSTPVSPWQHLFSCSTAAYSLSC